VAIRLNEPLAAEAFEEAARRIAGIYVSRHFRHARREKPLHYLTHQPATESHPLVVSSQEELVQLPRDLVFGSKHSFGEADQRSVWARQYVTEPTFRLFEGLTPLVRPNSHGRAGHERGVGIIPGHDVQRGQLGDVAGDGVT
jgi:hypothetical protein